MHIGSNHRPLLTLLLVSSSLGCTNRSTFVRSDPAFEPKPAAERAEVLRTSQAPPPGTRVVGLVSARGLTGTGDFGINGGVERDAALLAGQNGCQLLIPRAGVSLVESVPRTGRRPARERVWYYYCAVHDPAAPPSEQAEPPGEAEADDLLTAELSRLGKASCETVPAPTGSHLVRGSCQVLVSER